MKLSGIDANLIVALDALLKERNVTRAAARLGLGQPALSHTLARLRRQFKDPLLVAKGRKLELTPKAVRLLEPVAEAAAALGAVFVERSGLDLETPRKLVVACADLFALRFVPSIAEALRREAPRFELELRQLGARSTEAIMADGVDIAFGVFEDVSPGLNQQHLFRDKFVCVVRADHPKVGAALPLRTYVTLQHLEVAPAPNTRPGMRIDRLLAAKGLRRKVTLRVPYFALAARLLATSDHVLTMTRAFADELVGLAPLRVVKCPLPLEPLSFSQIWPRALDADPTHRWLREVCARVCGREDERH